MLMLACDTVEWMDRFEMDPAYLDIRSMFEFHWCGNLRIWPALVRNDMGSKWNPVFFGQKSYMQSTRWRMSVTGQSIETILVAADKPRRGSRSTQVDTGHHVDKSRVKCVNVVIGLFWKRISKWKNETECKGLDHLANNLMETQFHLWKRMLFRSSTVFPQLFPYFSSFFIKLKWMNMQSWKLQSLRHFRNVRVEVTTWVWFWCHCKWTHDLVREIPSIDCSGCRRVDSVFLPNKFDKSNDSDGDSNSN